MTIITHLHHHHPITTIVTPFPPPSLTITIVSLQMIQLYPPIFVNVEFSRSFVIEYPVCATEKNIVVPYPTTDPDLLSGIFFEKNVKNDAKKLVTGTKSGDVGFRVRDKLLFYQGGMHGSCEDIRRALVSIMRDPRGRWAAQKGDRKREEGFLTARYCPIPVGDSPSSKRMYDVMHVSTVCHDVVVVVVVIIIQL